MNNQKDKHSKNPKKRKLVKKKISILSDELIEEYKEAYIKLSK